ncbi:hypothetical protein PHK61_23790 [Actinomycetospora lutea]|uniref:hypothetical protein n=1 Tax=Actinomycetospora lutea TaxID=663604 RepID=UPI002366CB15|nr:hypothetical protein [Actinomycetospora lutea]MDD7941449.1 hypothetical protein [Actinomycetospora lutea]
MTPRRRLSRAQAEDLLDGAGSGPLRDLLAAASGAPHREELAGEDAAISAFLAADDADVTAGPVHTRPAGVATARRGSWWRTPAGLASAVALAVAGAGVATGTAAVVWHEGPPTAPPTSSVPARPSTGAADPDALPDPTRIAECRAWSAAAPTRDTDPAFAALISAAGGTGNVDDLCARTGAPTRPPAQPPAVVPSGPAGDTTNGSPGSPGAPRSGSVSESDPARPSVPSGPAREESSGDTGASDGDGDGDGAGGRPVGPPATPPGQGRQSNGPADGRAVGSAAVPPGQAREDSGSPARGPR